MTLLVIPVSSRSRTRPQRRPDGKELGDGHPQTSGQENVQRQGQGATNETCEAAKGESQKKGPKNMNIKKNSHPGVDGMLINKPKLGTCLKIPDSIYFKIIHNNIIYIYRLFFMKVIGSHWAKSFHLCDQKNKRNILLCSSQKLIFLPYCRAQISATNQVLSKISATPTTQKERSTTSLDHPKHQPKVPSKKIQHPTYLWIHMLLTAYTHTHVYI